MSKLGEKSLVPLLKSVSYLVNTVLHRGASSKVFGDWSQSIIAVGNKIMCLYYFSKVMSYYYQSIKMCVYRSYYLFRKNTSTAGLDILA